MNAFFALSRDVKRNSSIDFISGVMICYMVFYHITIVCGVHTIISDLVDRLLFFFMAWFYYKSGFFFKKRSLSCEVRTSVKRFIFPFITYGLISHFLFHAVSGTIGEIDWNQAGIGLVKCLLKTGTFSANPPLWFLLSLFFVRIIYQTCRQYRVNVVAILIICFAIAFSIHYLPFFVPWYLGNICLGFIFYTMGVNHLKWSDSMLVCCIALVVFLIIVVCFPSSVVFFDNKVLNGSYILWFVSSIAGVIILNKISTFNFVHSWPIHFIARIGKNSLNFYTIHWIVISITCLFFWGERQLFYILLIANICVLPITSWLINKTNFNHIVERLYLNIYSYLKKQRIIFVYDGNRIRKHK